MKIDIQRALRTPFNIADKSDAFKIYILAAVFSFFGFFSFRLNLSKTFNNYGDFSSAQDELNNQIHSLMSQSWFVAVIVILGIVLLALIVLKIFCASIVWGYILETIQGEFLNKNDIMPLWQGNIIKFFKKGFASYLIRFIYGIVLLFIPLGIIGFNLFKVIPVFNQIHSLNEFIAQVLSPVMIIGIVLLVITSSVLAFIMPSVLVNYARYGTFLSGFDFTVILSTIFRNILDYLVTILIQIPFIIGLIIINIGLCCTCVGILLIPFVNCFIYQIIIMNLFAQTIKE